MGFKADSFHHQHTVAEQALNPLLVKLLEKVAAVGSNWVHAPPSRRPRTKGADKQWSLMPRLDAKGHPNRPTDLCFTVMKGEHCVRWCGAVPVPNPQGHWAPKGLSDRLPTLSHWLPEKKSLLGLSLLLAIIYLLQTRHCATNIPAINSK